MKKTAIIFPGQGSQYIGMGQQFLESDSDARDLMDMACEASGLNLKSLCLEGPMEELTRSLHIQPAITVINMICWQQLSKRIEDFSPAFIAGHSLGECCALFASQALGAKDTISLVSKRGAYMDREATANPGGMRAVLGLDIGQVEEVLKGFNDEGTVVVANHNTKQQIVVSGDLEALESVSSLFKDKGGKVIPLKVSVANHSPLIAGAIPDYQAFLETLNFSKPKTPIMFNLNAAVELNPANIPQTLSNQIGSRVRWYESILKMLDEGVELFVELGPKTVLTGLVKKIVSGADKTATFVQADTPEGLDRVVSAITNPG